MPKEFIMLAAIITMSSLSSPGNAVAHEFEVSALVGTYGCTNVSVDVDLAEVDGIPERVVLRLEGVHSPGLHNSCVQEPYPAGAEFYSLVEIVSGLRADASGSLSTEAGAFVLELEFANHLWQFDMPAVPLELWFCTHPDFTPVLCDGWFECPATEITTATLIVEPAVPTNGSTWSDIKSDFEE